MIAKGNRNAAVMESIKKNTAVYFAATGGCGALISKSIKKYTVLAYADLGPEALAAMEVEDFPVTVVADCYGGDQYKEGTKAFAEI